jgi:hypothetical protein
MSEANEMLVEIYEIISTSVGVCITFFPPSSINLTKEGQFCLHNDDLVISAEGKQIRFTKAARSRSLQIIDELSIVGITKDNEIVVDIDCGYDVSLKKSIFQ